MAFFGKKFTKLTEKWIPVAKSVSCYDAKRLAKDIEKESTVSQTDVMAAATLQDNHCSALTAKGRNTVVFLPFLYLRCQYRYYCTIKRIACYAQSIYCKDVPQCVSKIPQTTCKAIFRNCLYYFFSYIYKFNI